MRLMYLHSYQSYVWNKVTTKRVELYGFEPALGDLVKKRKSNIFVKSDNEKDEEIIVLNEQNLNEFTIEDVILPLPGHSVIYPNNECNFI